MRASSIRSVLVPTVTKRPEVYAAPGAFELMFLTDELGSSAVKSDRCNIAGLLRKRASEERLAADLMYPA